MVEEFGLGACSTSVQTAWRNHEYDQEHNVVHAIEPRRDRNPTLRDGRNKRWLSAYYEVGGDGNKLLRESGFDGFPVLAQPWYYAPEMTPEEVLLIKSWDSREDGRARFTPHSAVDLLQTPKDAPPRESIEVRTLVVFDE